MRPESVVGAARSALSSPRLTAALATTGIGVGVFSFAIGRTLGQPALLAALATLIVLMALSLLARREELSGIGIPPVSLLAFLAWCAISLIWSEYQWATLGGLVSLAAFTVIAGFVALSRDTIQIVRAMGDVLRAALAVSIGLEIVSGVLLDAPIRFLAIQGRIAELGPVSGIFATRNQLGLLAIIAVITFVIELRTRSVSRWVGIGSLVLAAACIGFTRSPVIALAAVVVGIAAAVIVGVRRIAPERRQYWQFTILGLAIVAGAVAWILRSRIVELFNAGGELTYRLGLWDRVLKLIGANGLEGWGWIGSWHTDLPPFVGLQTPGGRQVVSALNVYLDIWLQVGLVGLVVFAGMVGLAFARSWLLAGRRRSVIYAWPAAVLVALITTGFAESSLLVDAGWMIFVICCMKASQELSWRTALARRPGTELPHDPTGPMPIQAG